MRISASVSEQTNSLLYEKIPLYKMESFRTSYP